MATSIKNNLKRAQMALNTSFLASDVRIIMTPGRTQIELPNIGGGKIVRKISQFHINKLQAANAMGAQNALNALNDVIGQVSSGGPQLNLDVVPQKGLNFILN